MKNSFGPAYKLVSLILAAILCLSFTACGSADMKQGDSPAKSREDAAADLSPQEPDPVEISLWTYPIGNWSNSTVIASLLADFNKQYPHIRVSVKYLDYNTGDSLVEEAIADGQSPDIIFEGPERLCTNWGARGLMEIGRAHV